MERDAFAVNVQSGVELIEPGSFASQGIGLDQVGEQGRVGVDLIELFAGGLQHLGYYAVLMLAKNFHGLRH